MAKRVVVTYTDVLAVTSGNIDGGEPGSTFSTDIDGGTP